MVSTDTSDDIVPVEPSLMDHVREYKRFDREQRRQWYERKLKALMDGGRGAAAAVGFYAAALPVDDLARRKAFWGLRVVELGLFGAALVTFTITAVYWACTWRNKVAHYLSLGVSFVIFGASLIGAVVVALAAK